MLTSTRFIGSMYGYTIMAILEDDGSGHLRIVGYALYDPSGKFLNNFSSIDEAWHEIQILIEDEEPTVPHPQYR